MTYKAYVDGRLVAAGSERAVRYHVAGWLTRLMGDRPTPELADDLMAAKQWFNNPEENYEADIRTGEGTINLRIIREGE